MDENLLQNLDNVSLNSEEDLSLQSWHDMVQNISLNHLSTLKTLFKKSTDDEGLSKEEFVNSINEAFNHSNYVPQSIALFDEINKMNPIKVTWSEFLDFLLKNLMPTSLKTLSLHLGNIIAVPQTRRETIVKIVLIETEKYFCYAMISKHGRVGLYDGNLNFLTTYHLIMTREDINRKEEHRRRRNRWVTDAIFCVDILMFIATNTARSVVIYEASGLKHVPLWLILSTPNIVECFAYKSSSAEKNESVLFMGDDSGIVFSFMFLQPRTALLRKKHNDKMNLFYWDELPNEKDFIIIKRNGRFHPECVRHLKYFDDNETLISCSKDSNSSVVIKYIGNKNKPYIFKMPKGCNCFALSRVHKVLISGSEDGTLRLWNPIITSKPVGIITGHQARIADVKIMDKSKLFMSCSSGGTFKLWDLKEQKCIQSFTVNFPSFTIFGKAIEWGIESIYPGPKRSPSGHGELDVWERSPMLVACCNHIALIKIIDQNDEIEIYQEMQVLPPPPLQNSVLVPKLWKTSDNVEDFREDVEEQIDSTILERRLKELSFILEKDLFADGNGVNNNSDINFKIATLERKKLKMQEHVARGAPYLALELHEVDNLCLTPNLPVPNKKRIKNIVGNIEKVLQDASCRDLIFSEPSSSRSPRSSRSSFVEFEY